MFGLQDHDFNDQELDRFRGHQRTTYAVLESVGRSLREGDTEHEVCRRLRRELKRAGAQNWFHVPVALFGDRTAYPGDFGALGALPTERRLQSNDPVILDAAPIFDGYTVDCSFGLRFGVAPLQDCLETALAELRGLIRDRANQRQTMRSIAQEVDARIAALGLENCHRKHIGLVLGHRVTRERNAILRGRSVWGLAPRQAGYFALNSLRARRGAAAHSPNWNHTRQSDCPVPDGLWAIEPHVALNGEGLKFEELLVVRDGVACYLDEDLPHRRRWRELERVA